MEIKSGPLVTDSPCRREEFSKRIFPSANLITSSLFVEILQTVGVSNELRNIKEHKNGIFNNFQKARS